MLGWLAGHFAPAVYACDMEINIEVVIHAREIAQSVLGSCLWGAGLGEVGKPQEVTLALSHLPVGLLPPVRGECSSELSPTRPSSPPSLGSPRLREMSPSN